MNHIEHTIKPVFNKDSKVLILGSFPSVKSREDQFFYGHPQNRFWEVISHLTNTKPTPKTTNDKKQMLLTNNIAVFDVIKSCDITGSSDSSIKNVEPWDLSPILKHSCIKNIYANGSKAYQLYMKYCYSKTNMLITKLPSTSPANASYNLEKLLLYWKQIIVWNLIKLKKFTLYLT